MKDDDVQNKGCVCSLDLVFRPEIKRNAIFPFFELLVKLADRIKQLTVGLFRCFGGVKSFVHATFDGGKLAHRPEQVEFALAIRERDVADIIWRILTRELNVHVIVILHRRSTRTQADTTTRQNNRTSDRGTLLLFIKQVGNPKDPFSLFDFDRIQAKA